jgi:phosphoketolase
VNHAEDELMRARTETRVTDEELARIDAYWRATNYLAVGQIYLLDNALLREPLRPEHVKRRLLGHWGTTPGLNLLYAHLNRIIADRGVDMLYVTGPGHGGPGLVANVWLEGTLSEVYPNVSRDESGMQRLFKQFSFPGGVPSHVAPETPARSTRAANSDTRCPMPTGPRSTTPTSWWPASSATVRPRPDRSRRHGTATSSSTRPSTARCCRSST